MVELSAPVKFWKISETIAIEGLQVQFLSVSCYIFFVYFWRKQAPSRPAEKKQYVTLK